MLRPIGFSRLRDVDCDGEGNQGVTTLGKSWYLAPSVESNQQRCWLLLVPIPVRTGWMDGDSTFRRKERLPSLIKTSKISDDRCQPIIVALTMSLGLFMRIDYGGFWELCSG